MYATLPFTDSAIYTGRTFNGIAVGLAMVPFLVYTGEVSSKENRGLCGIEQFSFAIGIALQMNLTAQWNFAYEPIASDRLHGILDIAFSLLAALGLRNVIESPVFYLQKNDELQALNSVMNLDSFGYVIPSTYTKLEQYKDYVRCQDNISIWDSVKHSTWPLIKIIVFRSMMLAFTFSTPLNEALKISSTENDSEFWAPTAAACLRIVGAFLAICLVSGYSRKLPAIISTGLMGIFVVLIAANYVHYENYIFSYKVLVVIWLSIAVQLLAGFYAPYTSVYIAEAFSLKCKPYFIALSICVEQVLQIVVIYVFNSWDYNIDSVLLVQGILICCGAVFALMSLPETKHTTLHEAQKRFNELFYFKLC